MTPLEWEQSGSQWASGHGVRAGTVTRTGDPGRMPARQLPLEALAFWTKSSANEVSDVQVDKSASRRARQGLGDPHPNSSGVDPRRDLFARMVAEGSMKAAFVLGAGVLVVATVGLARASVLDPDIVGYYVLDETGSSITGDYQLSQTPASGMSRYEVLRQPDDELAGYLELQEQGNSISGNFTLMPVPGDPNPNDYELTQQSGNSVIGDYVLVEQGNAITGVYDLKAAPSVPEPATAAMWACAASAWLAWRARLRATCALASTPQRSQPRMR